MSYYPTPGAPYVPQQSVNPYGGMGTVGLATPLPNTQMQQAQPQRPQPMNRQQPVHQSAQDGGWGNYGNGRNGGDNGMNSYIPYLVGTGATGQGDNDTRAALSVGFYQQDTSKIQSHLRNSIKIKMLHPVR